MTTCLICKDDISQDIQQFGKAAAPICCSCFLDGGSWIYDEPEVIKELQRGATLDYAIKVAIKEEITELEIFARTFFEVIA